MLYYCTENIHTTTIDCIDKLLSDESDSSAGMVEVILAGVPEQVNIPISILKERSLLASDDIQLTFREVKGGTGAMLDLLESGEVDLALTVTDALIVGIANGRKVELVGTFVDSPVLRISFL